MKKEIKKLTNLKKLVRLESAKILKRVQDDKLGFTLAEVLITLGIIGVVAAMTMPSLIQKHQEKVTVAKLKKVYSVLSQAFLQACNEYGTPDSWELAKNGEPAVNAAPKIKQFLKVADDCGVNDCENYSIRGGHFRVLRGGIYGSGYYSNDYKLKLTDGTELSFRENSPVFMALVDINGQQGPNTMGKDIFHFAFRSDGTMVPGGIGADPKNMGFSACNPKMEGWNCAAWVIYNENMDYLRCADELSWDGKHKCSD